MIGIKSNKIILDGKLFDGYIYLNGDKIIEVSTQEKECDIIYDYTGKFVSPGFIDTHTHGGGGYPFASDNPDDIINGADYHLKFGTTTIAPTVSASAFEQMSKSLDAISKAKRSGKSKTNILGAHLEGPYLSKKQCGAQCPDFITPPLKSEYESVVNKYGSDIARWTYAPENDANGEFCAYLTSKGIVASIGHSDAKYDEVAVGIENGANLVTHLYSCTSTVTRDHGFRSLGVIESAFLRDELYAEIIADGKHLPPDLIKMIIKIKGTDKVCLTTDSLEVAGTTVKSGTMCGTDFIVEDGVAKLPDRSAFAGSVATANTLIKTLVFECGYSVEQSVKMLTKIPAQIMKLNKGIIAKGLDADLVVFDDNIEIDSVFVMGNKVI
ncbi:MAG: N-acetylglucosamine-6-phosphate deacetylase [Clostridia bacterium]|nr:N-acetylglucosamine-6-phosphate deacetylase [Clostridia bacterium]